MYSRAHEVGAKSSSEVLNLFLGESHALEELVRQASDIVVEAARHHSAHVFLPRTLAPGSYRPGYLSLGHIDDYFGGSGD